MQTHPLAKKMRPTITLPMKEYHELVEKKLRYEYFRQVIEDDIFSPPPTKDVGNVIKGFSQTKKYTREFLKSLEKGLKRSSYFKI